MHPENMKSSAITIVTVLGIMLGAVPIASAQNIKCTGTISDGSTIDSNLIVPANASCTLKSVTVNGNVSVGAGASLAVEAFNGQTVTVNGNLTANQCKFVDLLASLPPFFQPGTILVAGNVTIQNCPGGGSFRGPTVTINGNFVCTNSSSVCSAVDGVVQGNVTEDDNGTSAVLGGASVVGNQISGNVDVSGNTGHDRAALVSNNTINGNLTCFDNTTDIAAPPVSDNGVPNTVSGTKQGQCANL